MILLPELLSLLEAPARMHVNGKLSVIADLVKDEFGDEMNGIPIYNKCLIAQVAYSLHARTRLTVERIVHIFTMKYIKSPKDDPPMGIVKSKGISPENVYRVFDKTVVSIGGKRFRLDLGFHVYHSTAEVVAAVKSGNPVIVPYSIESWFDSGVESHDEEGKYNAGFVDRPENEINDSDYRHCLLAIGVDEDSEELILRDTRSRYLYKGYVKVPFKAFDNYIKTTFSFDVDMTEV